MRVKHTEAAAQRYVISFVASDPEVIGGLEVVACTVVGQSFLMHMIRKMVAMASLIVSQRAPACVQQLSLSTTPFPTAMAPGLGLLLDETIFESYNTRYDKEKEAHEGTAHVRLSLDAISGAVQQFKRARIYPHIAQTELQDRPFRTFLEREDERPTDWAGLISASEKHTHAAAVGALQETLLQGQGHHGQEQGQTQEEVPHMRLLVKSDSGSKILNLQVRTLGELRGAVAEALQMRDDDKNLQIRHNGRCLTEEAFASIGSKCVVDVSGE